MQAITTVGLNIAKSVFQVHGVDAAGQVVTRRQLKRRYVLTFFQKPPPCLVGIEARLVTPLVARAQGARLYGAIDATGLREAIRQTAEKRGLSICSFWHGGDGPFRPPQDRGDPF